MKNMAEKTRVTVIRHCEAEGNLKRIFQGHTNAAISENGKKQLDLLRLRCRNLPIDVIYTSPLQRAYLTAEAVNSFRNAPVHLCDDLMEINGGVWEGKRWADLPALYPEDARIWNLEPQNFAPKNGEPMRHVYERMSRAVTEIVRRHPGGQICITSHGCAIRNLLCWAMGKPVEELNTVDWCDNTAISILEFDENAVPTVLLANDASHLDHETSTFSKQTWWKPEHRTNEAFEEAYG